MSSLPQDEFRTVTEFLQQQTGIALSDEKYYLVESRLQPLVRKHGFDTLSGLIGKLRMEKHRPDLRAGTLACDVLDALTTNETSFFRDTKPFDQFRTVLLPHILENQKSGALRIWSAACSSGQEGYSLAICIKEEAAKTNGRQFEIIGTDICHEVLDKARKANYSQFEVQRGMPIQMLLKYFKQEGERWQLNDDIRKMVVFDYLNLMESFAKLGKFDLIYCRNVLIYFDYDTKKAVLERLSQCLRPHGVIVLGSSESAFGMTDVLEPMEGVTGGFRLSNAMATASS